MVPPPKFTLGSSTQRPSKDSSSPYSFSPFTQRPVLARPRREEIEDESDHEGNQRESDLERSHVLQHSSKKRRPNPSEPVLISSDPASPVDTPPTTPPPHEANDHHYNRQDAEQNLSLRPSPSSRHARSTPAHAEQVSTQHGIRKATPRFIADSTPNSATQSSTTHRPQFILGPPRSPSPDGIDAGLTSLFFSPTKPRTGGTGPRYVPGGLAATVRNWVIEAATSNPSNSESSLSTTTGVKPEYHLDSVAPVDSSLDGADYAPPWVQHVLHVTRLLKTTETYSDGSAGVPASMTLLRAHSNVDANGENDQWALIGPPRTSQSSSSGLGLGSAIAPGQRNRRSINAVAVHVADDPPRLAVGSALGVREPVWSMGLSEPQGEGVWRVAVEWTILPQPT